MIVPPHALSRPARPALRFHGGKFRLASWIVSHLPPHQIFVEPYGGGASVLMCKPRSFGEVYNDLDGDVVNFFRVLQDPDTAQKLEQLLRITPYARAEFQAAFAPTADPVERARRLVILAFMGKSSACCTTRNQDGSRNRDGWRKYVRPGTHGPHPAREWSTYPDVIPAFTERLRGVFVDQIDARRLIPQHDAPDTLFYVDPPYPFSSRGADPRPRYAVEMTDEEHQELALLLRGCRGMVVISGYPSRLYDALYAGWRRVATRTHADAARPRTECLWSNPAAAAALSSAQPSLFEEADGIMNGGVTSVP